MSTYIYVSELFVIAQPKYTAVGSFSWHYSTSISLLCIAFFNLNRLLFSTFQIFLLIFNKTYYNLSFYSDFSTPITFFVESELMFIKHNISIATDDDIIHIGDDVNIYPVYSPSAIIIWGKLSQLA